MFINCGGFHINEEKLKVIDGVLTKQDSVEITNKGLAGCGGLVIDTDVFKFDDKSNSLTMKEAESVTESIIAPCGGLKLDSAYFEIGEDGNITLKEIGVNMMKSPVLLNVPVTKVTFESLDEFTIEVRDEENKIVEPIEDKMYELQKTKLYTYKAISSNDEVVDGNITTTSRQSNLTKTIEF